MMVWMGSDDEDVPMTNGLMPNLDGPTVTNLGNTNMQNIPKDGSAMDLMNDPATKQTFGLGSAPIPRPVAVLVRRFRSSIGPSATFRGRPVKLGES